MKAPGSMTYRLASVPQARRVPVTVPANAYRMPLGTTADYGRAMAADDYRKGATEDSNDEGRVLLDHVQYFAFLAQLTTRLREACGPGTLLFLEVCAPYFGSLPAVLLEPGVLLGSGVHDEASWHAALGATVVWVGDRFRRDLDYAGDNTLRCVVWPAGLAAAVNAVMHADWSSHAVELIEGPHPIHAVDSGAEAPPGSTRHE
jgi:hypothetical protein